MIPKALKRASSIVDALCEKYLPYIIVDMIVNGIDIHNASNVEQVNDYHQMLNEALQNAFNIDVEERFVKYINNKLLMIPKYGLIDGKEKSIGLFEPTNKIYIDKSLPYCVYTKSILIHEYTHYLFHNLVHNQCDSKEYRYSIAIFETMFNTAVEYIDEFNKYTLLKCGKTYDDVDLYHAIDCGLYNGFISCNEEYITLNGFIIDNVLHYYPLYLRMTNEYFAYLMQYTFIRKETKYNVKPYMLIADYYVVNIYDAIYCGIINKLCKKIYGKKYGNIFEIYSIVEKYKNEIYNDIKAFVS